ncbi:MAG TPA: C1 family peptidase [Candidatus Omnitrophota bacterium]|nr:C1 family peptidase [Candidatus Omnitrophota bacterium]
MYALGCRKDVKDLRDIPMGLVLPAIRVPDKVDYTALMTPVRDQGSEGTCVAFASVVGVKEYADKKEYKRLVELSPRYVYSLCKQLDGIPEEEGTYPRVAMKVLLKNGVCPESYWPYRPHQADDHKRGAHERARTYRIKAYARIRGLAEMKRSLLVNGPFLAGVQVFDNWFTKRVERTGRISMPAAAAEPVGGHAICIVGYDERRKLFTFKNSWSRAWADRGYGYLPYAYMQKYCMDAWSATDLIENPAALVRSIESVLKRYA